MHGILQIYQFIKSGWGVGIAAVHTVLEQIPKAFWVIEVVDRWQRCQIPNPHKPALSDPTKHNQATAKQPVPLQNTCQTLKKIFIQYFRLINMLLQRPLLLNFSYKDI